MITTITPLIRATKERQPRRKTKTIMITKIITIAIEITITPTKTTIRSLFVAPAAICDTWDLIAFASE